MRPRVLVTGFHDWRQLGDANPNLWRCRDNPSCRLILGFPSASPPLARDGCLPSTLRNLMPGVSFSFVTLPTAWGTAQGIDFYQYDVVIHMGLGVYDCHDKILVEDGAWNGRVGKDAAGHESGATIEMGQVQCVRNEAMSAVARSLHGATTSAAFESRHPRRVLPTATSATKHTGEPSRHLIMRRMTPSRLLSLSISPSQLEPPSRMIEQKRPT